MCGMCVWEGTEGQKEVRAVCRGQRHVCRWAGWVCVCGYGASRCVGCGVQGRGGGGKVVVVAWVWGVWCQV